MASIVDIPAKYMKPSEKVSFFRWVKLLDIPVHIRRDLVRSWRHEMRLHFDSDDYKRCGLLMPRRFAHLLPQDAEVWERFLSDFGALYESFEYDVRVGLGREAGPEYEDNLRKMSLDLSLRRIDCVGYTPSTITVFEVTVSAGFKALGQIYGYPILYSLTFMPSNPIQAVLVCKDIQTDIKPVLDSLGIVYYTV